MAKDVKTRVQGQQRSRREEGWVEVRVWVPSEADAEKLRVLAAHMRDEKKRSELQEGRETFGNPRNFDLMQEAVMNHGLEKGETPSWSMLEVLRDTAIRGEMSDFSREMMMVRRGKPGNYNFVEGKIQAIILNKYLAGFRGLKWPSITAWLDRRPDWGSELKKVVLNPDLFQSTLERFATEIG